MNYPERLPPYQITLITGERGEISRHMHTLTMQLALAGPIKLLICGNRYNHYRINYAVAAATNNYQHILAKNIYLSRAETCYQLTELLSKTLSDSQPTLIFDLLSTFYDEGVNEQEISELLSKTITHLRRLNKKAPIVVSVAYSIKRPNLLKVLEKNLDSLENLSHQSQSLSTQINFGW